MDPTILDHKLNRTEGRNSLRRLSVVKDVDGKSRVIAMGDYWSQTVLKPLHDTIMASLRGIKSDVTYGQSIAPFGSCSEDYHSFDLTSATDRIPVEIYQILLMALWDRDYAKAWKDIMVNIPFNWKDSSVKYATGQPMGMYSSWALMALGHHLIVRYSAN